MPAERILWVCARAGLEEIRSGGGLAAEPNPACAGPDPAPLAAEDIRDGCTERYGGETGPPPGEAGDFDMSARSDDDVDGDADGSWCNDDRGCGGGCKPLICTSVSSRLLARLR